MYIEDLTKQAHQFRVDSGIAPTLFVLVLAPLFVPLLPVSAAMAQPNTEADAPQVSPDVNTVSVADGNAVSAAPVHEVNDTLIAADQAGAWTASFEQITANQGTVAAWKDRIAAPPTDKPADSRQALRQLIEMVRSVRIDLPDNPDLGAGERYGQSYRQHPGPSAAPPNPADVNQTPGDAARQTAGPRLTAVPFIPGAGITEATVAEVRKQIDVSRPIADALTLAEVLFRSGRNAEAAALYDRILTVTDPNDRRAADDRAWALLQRGRCLHETDGAAAMESYRGLLREFPQSPWVAVTKAQMELVAWLAQDKPLDLLEQCRTEIAEVRQLSKIEGIVQNEP